MDALIRLAHDSDAAAVADIYRPAVEFSPISFETEPPDAGDMRRRLAQTLPQHPWLVCERGRRVVGYAYASRHHERAAYQWSVNVSVYVEERARRTGVGRGLYLSLLAILAAQGYVNAYAGITLPNPGSVGLHEAVGFERFVVYRKVGFKLGAWHDVGWWHRSLAPHRIPAQPPLDVIVLARSPEWPALLGAGVPCIRVDGAC